MGTYNEHIDFCLKQSVRLAVYGLELSTFDILTNEVNNNTVKHGAVRVATFQGWRKVGR